MPSAMIIGDMIPLPLSTQLISDYQSDNAQELIKWVEGESTDLFNTRLQIAQNIIDSSYDLLEGLEGCYFTNNLIMQLTNLIIGRIHYNVSYGAKVDELTNIIMEAAGI